MITGWVVVTGAGGFVLGNCVPALAEQGWRVLALDHAFDSETLAVWSCFGDRVRTFIGDVADLNGLALDAPVAGVIHGAAVTATPEEMGLTPEQYFRANLEPTLHILEWARAYPEARVILISSSAVYEHTAPGPITETMPPFPFGLYSISKAALESLADTLRRQYQRDVLAVRLSNLYGPIEQPRPTRPRISLVGRMVREALTEGRITIYTDTARVAARDWTFAPDIGRALGALLQTPSLPHALYNVASGEVLRPIDIASIIAEQTGAQVIEAPVDPLPGAPRYGYLTNDRLRADTGFAAWTPFAAGIAAVLAAAKVESV